MVVGCFNISTDLTIVILAYGLFFQWPAVATGSDVALDRSADGAAVVEETQSSQW